MCKILSVEGNVVKVDKLNAFDKTPVLDLKPVIALDLPEGIKGLSWLSHPTKKA